LLKVNLYEQPLIYETLGKIVKLFLTLYLEVLEERVKKQHKKWEVEKRDGIGLIKYKMLSIRLSSYVKIYFDLKNMGVF